MSKKSFGASAQEGLVDAFFRCWTRKEAYVKGRGDGLALPLQDFDVSLLPNEPARLLATRPDSGDASRWELADLAAFTGYASALPFRNDSLTPVKLLDALGGSTLMNLEGLTEASKA